MDDIAIEYLSSGKAIVLVGSGPSCQMQYPSWSDLAKNAMNLYKLEGTGSESEKIERAYARKEFPIVFELIGSSLGYQRLLSSLQSDLKPKKQGLIYEKMVRWPVPIYLTTNYDDEIQSHLAKIGESYNSYLNSTDHISLLEPDLFGGIFKLHGDLRSNNGLVLSSNQYKDIEYGEEWKHWRTKLTSIFQLCKVVIIGHSLTDPNIRHILKAAKEGAGVVKPICWIAPDVSSIERREYLEKFRIRVISYDNRDGSHDNLLKLIESLSYFIPPRESIPIDTDIQKITESKLGDSSAAPAFYVFNKLFSLSNYEDKRISIILAAVEPALKVIQKTKFTLNELLEISGWPEGVEIDNELKRLVQEKGVGEGLFEIEDGILKKSVDNQVNSQKSENSFLHLKERFVGSIRLKIRKYFPSYPENNINEIAYAIESSLVGYFKEGGLTLASILFNTDNRYQKLTLPRSIAKFISESSAQFPDYYSRQVYNSISIDIFVNPSTAEKSYLGRISQGFFAYNALGVFGDVAEEKNKFAKDTVWLVDSNSLIPILAIGSATNFLFKETYQSLKSIGVRFFTTENLFSETWVHFWFADNLVTKHGENSPNVIAAATGQAPYYKPNVFLDGFIRWGSKTSNSNWNSYLETCFGTKSVNETILKERLRDFGVDTIEMQDWPGFEDSHFVECDEYKCKIVDIYDSSGNGSTQSDYHKTDTVLDRKAKPEAEALVIIKKEREGRYYILSDPDIKSEAWFISSTSILNILHENITWRPEAFLRYASTLTMKSESYAEEQAFETILLNIAQSGKNILDEDLIEKQFGSFLNQSILTLNKQREIYSGTLAVKYGEQNPETLLNEIKPSIRPLASIQLAMELMAAEKSRRETLEDSFTEVRDKLDKADEELAKVRKLRKKITEKEEKAKRAKLKAKNKTRKKKKKRKKRKKKK